MDQTENCCNKTNHIGEYPIVNCQLYGEFKAIKKLELGDNLYLKLDNDDEKNILVVALYKDENNQESKVIIGELHTPDTDKKAFLPYLKQKWDDKLYICKLSQKDEKVKLGEQLRISIWVKKYSVETQTSNIT